MLYPGHSGGVPEQDISQMLEERQVDRRTLVLHSHLKL